MQKSVFEGIITEGTLAMLKKDLHAVLDKDKDFVIIYSLSDSVKINREIITNTSDPIDNFL